MCLLLLVALNLLGSGSTEELSCLLADMRSDGGAVWSIGGTFPVLYAEYYGNNPVSDVCIGEDRFFTSGASSTIGGDPSTGGHIAAFDITGVPLLVAQFPAICTAIECDTTAQVLVVAVEGVGISACSHDGIDCWNVVDISGSDVTNLFVDSCSQTCYFVDKTTSSVYAVNYMVRSQGAAVPIGSAGAGAVGCTLDYVGGSGHLNILYSDCSIERCPVGGPFLGCLPPLRDSTGGNCVAMSNAENQIITYDGDQKSLAEISPSDGAVKTSIVDVPSVSGIDCSRSFCEDDIDHCASSPCLHGGTCENLINDYTCICISGLHGKNCENGSVALMEVLQSINEFNEMLSNADFMTLAEYYADDAIIDFTGHHEFIGPSGNADLAAITGALYSDVELSFLGIRELCDMCFQDRFITIRTRIDDPNGPKSYGRSVRVWCFDFESLMWKVQSLTVIDHPPPE